MTASPEYPTCAKNKGAGRRVHGNFAADGLSIDWHDFATDDDLDWSAGFHRESLEICLNFSGRAQLEQNRPGRELGAEQVALYLTGHRSIRAERCAGPSHRFFTFTLSVDFLREQLGPRPAGVKREIRDFLESPGRARSLVGINALPAHLLNYRLHLLEPPIQSAAHAVWYQGKTAELISHFLFEPQKPAELFCHRHHRLNRERCERALFLLERDLENPPSLEMLAAEVQCSSFYLSRLFVQRTGMSIPRYLRMKRLEKAAALLRGGKTSVTEAAMAVGYASLGSFNKAFVAHFGCCPGLYPHARSLLKRAAL